MSTGSDSEKTSAAMAKHPSTSILFFDGFRFDRQAGGLFRAGEGGYLEPVALGSRALELLDFLARRNGDPLSKDDIMNAVWSGRAVEEANLNVQVSKLRHVLDQDRPHGSCIQTMTGFGYRFVADVTSVDRSELSRHRSANEVTAPAFDPRPLGASKEPASTSWSRVEQEEEVIGLALSTQPARHAESEDGFQYSLRDHANSSLINDTLISSATLNRDCADVIAELRQRLIADYGDGATTGLLIDQIVTAYQDVVRLAGRVASFSTLIECEFFGGAAGKATVQNLPRSDKARTVDAIAEQHLLWLGRGLLPLVECRADAMREALAVLLAFRGARSGDTCVPLGQPHARNLERLGRQHRCGGSHLGNAGDVIPATDAEFY
jgi:DNA-binding winged helix-turn-helix (wHTH) protein